MAAKSQKKTIFIGAAAAVIIAGLIAYFTVATADPEAEEITVSGEPIPVLSGNVPLGQDIAFGWDAPLISGSDWNGNPVTIDPGDGRPKLIVFLAHWCPHCQEEVPEIQAWLNETGGNPDVDLYGVATSIDRSRPNWPPGGWLESEGWTPPTIIDKNNKAARSYGLWAFPYWVAVNAEGKLVFRAAAGIGVGGMLNFQQLATQSIAELEELLPQTQS